MIDWLMRKFVQIFMDEHLKFYYMGMEHTVNEINKMRSRGLDLNTNKIEVEEILSGIGDPMLMGGYNARKNKKSVDPY
jgi:hypothetical protein